MIDARPFADVYDFYRNGEVGDRFEESRPSSRTLHTHVIIERLEDTTAVVETIRTTHNGPAQIAGRPDRCYTSSLATNRVRLQGAFVYVDGFYEGRSGLFTQEPTTRYSSKRLAEIHKDSVATYDRHYAPVPA